jgi:hypothetical protein
MANVVLCILVGGQNGPKKSWTKILAETLAPLLLGIGIDIDWWEGKIILKNVGRKF